MNDILIATPKDFGFFGKGEGTNPGRYAPLRSAESHERFRADLERMLRLVLAGDTTGAKSRAAREVGGEIARMPAFGVTDLAGRPLSRDSLAGRVTIVEFWATWCPPCRGTLKWLGEVRRRYGDRVAVVALAVESDEQAVRDVTRPLDASIRWSMATPDIARRFGDVSALPTMFVFDAKGNTAGAYYGAPPGLHAEAESRIAALLR